jgi:hypothetical protein
VSPRPSLDARQLHEALLRALGDTVVTHSDATRKPLQLDLAPPLPARVRAYMYTLTDPPGGRPVGEFKVQLIAPGQLKSERASFDASDGRIVVLIGYHAATNVFVLWDAMLYPDFPHSRNVQVRGETVYGALAGTVARQERRLRTGTETVLAAQGAAIRDALSERFRLTVSRVTATK